MKGVNPSKLTSLPAKTNADYRQCRWNRWNERAEAAEQPDEQPRLRKTPASAGSAKKASRNNAMRSRRNFMKAILVREKYEAA